MTTLAEWQKVASVPTEIKGVFKTINTVSRVTPLLDFEKWDGGSVNYERELTIPTAADLSDEGTMADSDLSSTEVTKTLKTCYVQSLENLKAGRLANKTQPSAYLKMQMSKAWGRKLEDEIINGDSAVNALQFDGLNKIARGETRMMAMDDGNLDGPGAAETELTQDRLDQALATENGGEPWQAIICNATGIRKLGQLRRAAGSGVTGSFDSFGQPVLSYPSLEGPIPIVRCDYIPNTETYGDSGTWPSSTATTLYAVRFGRERQGIVCGHSGAFLNPAFMDIGVLTNKDSRRWRLIADVGMACLSPFSIVALGGIDSSA